jgi:hypothetical protein
MNRAYRQFRVAIRRRDKVLLSQAVREHPEMHDCRGGEALFHLLWEAPDLLETAFNAGLSPDAGQHEDCPQTFLQHCAAQGNVQLLRLALRHGADPSLRNSRGETALGYACSWGQLEVARALVAGGAEVNAVETDPEDGWSNTALDCCGKHPEIADFLRSVGGLKFVELSREGA